MSVLSTINDECVRCGICKKQQRAEGMPVLQVGDTARAIEAASDITEVSPEVYEFLVSCSLCDACTAACPQYISCAEMVASGRQKLLALAPELAKSYRAYRVDYKENVFAALREAAGYRYRDLLDEPAGEQEVSLFFPGCSLAGYSEELTLAVYHYLSKHALVQGMSVYCCGKVLSDSGEHEAHQRYGDGLVRLLREKQVTSMVVACPNCYYELRSLLTKRGAADITLKDVPTVLKDLGMVYEGSTAASYSLHTSCPDRYEQRFARSSRALFGPSLIDLRQMESHGVDTICCGAGGMARMNAPTLAAERRARRLKQFNSTGAECLVCSCMSCVNTFLGDLEAPQTKHILELLFDIDVDWDAARIASDKLAVEHEEVFSLPLEESTPVFDD